VIVNPQNEAQEKALFEFLDSKQYNYQSDDNALTESQKQEILRRDNDYISGKSVARD
jgi:hypothetical protein